MARKSYKFVLLVFCIFMFTGCNVTYNLEVNGDKVIESSDVYFENKDVLGTLPSVPSNLGGSSNNNLDLKKARDNIYENDYSAYYNDFSSFYAKKKLNDRIGINYSFSFNSSSYKNSMLLNSCFEDVSVYKYKDNMIFDFKNSSYCFNQDIYDKLDAVTINLKTNNKVLDNNADSVSNKVYTWNLNRDESKDIYVKFKLSDESNYNYLLIVLVIIFLTGLTVYVVFIIRKKAVSNNEI